MRGVGAALLTCLALAGCAASTGADSEPVYPPFRPTHPQVTQYCPDIPAAHLDGSSDDVDAVYRCTGTTLDDGRIQETVERLADDPTALLDVYREPDEPATDGACTRQYEDPLVLWVRRGEATIAVRAPVDGCRFPTQSAKDAIAAARFDRVLVARMTPQED